MSNEIFKCIVKTLFLIIFSIGIFGILSVSSQTAFGSQNELMKFLPEDYEQFDVTYNSDNTGETIYAKLIKNNQKYDVVMSNIFSINDAWNMYKYWDSNVAYAPDDFSISENWTFNSGECKKILINTNEIEEDVANNCIINNEYVLTIFSTDYGDVDTITNLIIEKIKNDGSLLECGIGTIEEDGVCVLDDTSSKGGGCLIATATYGSEMAPQVQQLRELRDNQLLNTASGTQFMGAFNDIYYSFSPIVADYERENPVFKEVVKIAITPMISSLSLMENAESDSEVISLGLSVIALNIGMYLGVPVVVIVGIRKRI
jgi:hypothetical protein